MPAAAPILSDDNVREFIHSRIPRAEFERQRVLLIVPDHTRTAPLPLLFDALFHHLRPVVDTLDVMFAL